MGFWRCTVPRQSAPVSPPPMMTTRLPVARMSAAGSSVSPRQRCSAVAGIPWHSEFPSARVLELSDRADAFEINTDGSGYTKLHDFAGGVTGYSEPPHADLLCSGGFLYGTTEAGGSYNNGTLFSLESEHHELHDSPQFWPPRGWKSAGSRTGHFRQHPLRNHVRWGCLWGWHGVWHQYHRHQLCDLAFIQ